MKNVAVNHLSDACDSIDAVIELKDKYSMVNITCFGNNACQHGKFIIQTGVDNYVAPNNTDSNFYFDCNGIQSCGGGLIAVIGIDNFELNCHGTEACKNADITSKSINGPKGIFALNCYGNSSCDRISIDCVSMNYVNINCSDEVLTCYEMQVNQYI